MDKKILYVCNSAAIAARFRLPLLKGALKEGYSVDCICGDGVDVDANIARMEAIGVAVHRLPGLEADGLSLGQLRSQARDIAAILDRVQPEIVHAFTHRANIASFLALRGRPEIRFIPNVTGAGRLFGADLSLRDRLARYALLRFYRAMAGRCECIFFQNDDDLGEIGGAMQLPHSRLRLTGGSGFDPSEVEFDQAAEVTAYRRLLAQSHGIAENKRMFLLPARALRTKGVEEFYTAAGRYLDLFDDAVFVHAGEAGRPPYGLAREELQAWQRPGLHYVGFHQDIYRLVNAADVVVLPSSYREGIPRALIEALYFGKSVLTTDNTGCREAVIDGWNGVLFKPKSSQALLTAFVAAQRIDAGRAGNNSRRLFARRFHADAVVNVYLGQYRAAV